MTVPALNSVLGDGLSWLKWKHYGKRLRLSTWC